MSEKVDLLKLLKDYMRVVSQQEGTTFVYFCKLKDFSSQEALDILREIDDELLGEEMPSE